MKKCTKCKLQKSYDMFYKKKQSKDGYDFWCKDCWRTKENSRNKSSKRYLEKNEYFTGSDLNKLLMNARKRANIKGLDYELTPFNVSPLLIEFCKTQYHSWSSGHPFKPSIDRIDSSKGYTLDNVQILWAIENHCKNIYTNEDVLNFCKLKLKL